MLASAAWQRRALHHQVRRVIERRARHPLRGDVRRGVDRQARRGQGRLAEASADGPWHSAQVLFHSSRSSAAARRVDPLLRVARRRLRRRAGNSAARGGPPSPASRCRRGSPGCSRPAPAARTRAPARASTCGAGWSMRSSKNSGWQLRAVPLVGDRRHQTRVRARCVAPTRRRSPACGRSRIRASRVPFGPAQRVLHVDRVVEAQASPDPARPR